MKDKLKTRRNEPQNANNQKWIRSNQDTWIDWYYQHSKELKKAKEKIVEELLQLEEFKVAETSEQLSNRSFFTSL